MSVGFEWATPRLAVGGRPAPTAYALSREHALAAVIDLRAETCDDEGALRAAGVAFLHLPTRDRHALAPSSLAEGVAFADKFFSRGHRVLVHCEHGIGRAPMLALCLMCESGDAPLDALRRLKAVRPPRSAQAKSPSHKGTMYKWSVSWNSSRPMYISSPAPGSLRPGLSEG